jgi:hypothetical protein
MKQLVEEDYNYFQWDGILEGIQKEKNEIIKNCFDEGVSVQRIAKFVKLTPKEVGLRINQMKLTRPTRSRTAVSPAN